MTTALFTSDLHGSKKKYEFLFNNILIIKPAVVFLGGDLMGLAAKAQNNAIPTGEDFLYDYLAMNLQKIRDELKNEYPAIFVILGNDDPKIHEAALLDISTTGLLTYVNELKVNFQAYNVIGYSYVPPTPFLNKDWEKYDVSRFVDVGCVSPEEGFRSIPISVNELRFFTIKRDLEKLFTDVDLSKTICLFHAPPYQTKLDRAALDGVQIDHAPLDVNVGSIAIKEFILTRSPYLTLHGHIHESSGITGSWKERIGDTVSFQGATEPNEYGIILFDLDDPNNAKLLKE